MVTKIEPLPNPPVEIKYRGLFDWDELYLAMAEWFKRYRFWFHEETYKHKVPSPRGAEQELHWWGQVDVTDYIRFKITVFFHLWDMTEVEVVRNGKKKLLTNARLRIELRGELIVDWQNRFDKNRFTRALGHLYNKFIYRRNIETIYGDMLIYRVYNFESYIKKLLDMQAKAHEYAGYLGEDR